MKTDYLGHDEIYRRRRSEGHPGWQDAASLQEALARLSAALQSEHAPQRGSALELGCGAGDLSLWLAEQGYVAHGIDIAPAAIAWARDKARERGVQAEFRTGDVLELAPYADESFDLVLDGYCFHCIIGEDRARFLASARRVLRPGGCLHISTMCGEVTSPELSRVFDPRSRCVVRADGVSTRYIGWPEDILAEIRGAGLQVLEWRVRARTDAVNTQDDLLVWATRG